MSGATRGSDFEGFDQPSHSEPYTPDLTGENTYNLACLPDFHSWQREGKDYAVGAREAEYFRELSERHGIDALCITGDFGSRNALEGFLDGMENEMPVYILEGDEDYTKDVKPPEPRIGWKRQVTDINQPIETETEYSIEGRSVEFNPFEDYKVWIQHEPHHENKEKLMEELMFNVDPLKRHQDYHPADIPHELGNEPVIAVHSHNHRPQPMEVGRSGVFSLGGGTYNYDVTCIMPDRSVHLLSLKPEGVENVHIDRGEDEVFEHHSFEIQENKAFDAAPEQQFFQKELKYCREGVDLKPGHRFGELPEEMIAKNDFVVGEAD